MKHTAIKASSANENGIEMLGVVEGNFVLYLGKPHATNIVQKLVHCFWSTLPNACVQFTTKNKTNAIQTSFRFYLLTDIHISCYEKVDMDDS